MEFKFGMLIALVLALLSLGLGVIIGFFASQRNAVKEPDRVRRSCGSGHTFYNTNVKSNLDTCLDDCRSSACWAESCEIPQPRSYVTYHLWGKTITVDGRIDEEAWNEVPWTENFVGEEYPAPHFETKVKIRWDDNNVYVAARLQERDIWANRTLHDSLVWQDNAFEVYFDVDGSTHNYQEIQINALQTTWDLMLTKAYVDGGEAQSGWESNVRHGVYTDGPVNDPNVEREIQPKLREEYPVRRSKAYVDGGEAQSGWESNVRHGVYTDGPVNDPNVENTYWSTEMVFPIGRLQMYTRLAGIGTPADMEIWRIVLARPEWKFNIIDGEYVKDESKDADWWSWNPHVGVNLHLPDRWGLLQFSRAPVTSNKQFTVNEQWKVSQALFDAFNAMKKFNAEYGTYTTELKMLELPQYLLSGLCVGAAQIYLPPGVQGFVVSISAKHGALKGHIRTDRYVWFGERDDGLTK